MIALRCSEFLYSCFIFEANDAVERRGAALGTEYARTVCWLSPVEFLLSCRNLCPQSREVDETVELVPVFLVFLFPCFDSEDSVAVISASAVVASFA